MDLKDIVLNVKQPTLLKNLQIKWSCFDQTFEKWLKSFDTDCKGDGFDFDSAPTKNGSSPQFERYRQKTKMKMKDFYDLNDTDDHWYSYSYKYIKDLPMFCKEGIDFGFLGFPDVKEEISFWIGSKHAHTPAHYDSFGCNVVIQVFGRKSWLMFPPSCKIKQIRTPYEESSIYCRENFYSPKDFRQFKEIENDAYYVELKPGDVLIVPHGWWHFVETLEKSLNFNGWIKLNTDIDNQISECITKLIIQDYTKNLEKNLQEIILNPNEVPTIDDDDSDSSDEILKDALNYLINQKKSNKKQKSSNQAYDCDYLSENDLKVLLKKYEGIVLPVEKLKNYEFFHFMKENSKRYSHLFDDATLSSFDVVLKCQAIDTCCNPEFIEMIKNKMI